MKKIIITLATLLLATTTLHAQTGEEIYNTKCLSCHVINSPIDMQGASGTPKFTKAFHALVAPPMERVVMKVNGSYSNKETFVAFVSKYITNPSLEEAVCGKRGIKKFGLMPPIGKSMTDDEKTKVSSWIFDTIASKVGKSCSACKSEKKTEKGEDCDSTNKCGSGSSTSKQMKCAPGKCGGK